MHLVSGRRFTVCLAAVMAIAGIGPEPANDGTQAASPAASPAAPVSFSLPDVSDRATDANRVVDAAPGTLTGPLDLQAAIDSGFTTADGLPDIAWEVPALARSLDQDAAAAFAVVRDSIRFEPYPGVLRGAAGTLAARAGNSFDRALLLRALLDEMGMTTRLAVGELDAATSEALAAHAFDLPARALQEANGSAVSTLDAAAITARARRDYALLQTALDGRMDGSGAEPVGSIAADIRHHAWVQVLLDGSWVDDDPSMANAQPGQSLTTATATSDTFDDADQQHVTLQVVAETLADGALADSLVLERRLTAAEATGSDIFLYFQPDSGGGGLLGGVGASTAFVPELLVDHEVQEGGSFPIGDGEDDSGFGLGGGGPAFVGLRLVITRDAPGQGPRATEVSLVDRMPPGVRATGSVSLDQLLPLATTSDGPLLLGRIHHVMVSVGAANPRAAAIRRGVAADFIAQHLLQPDAATKYGLPAALWASAASDADLVLASERVMVPAAADPGRIEAVVARPRVYIMSMGPDVADPTKVTIESDLAVDGIRLLARAGVEPVEEARRQMWYGVLETALESEVMRETLGAFDSDGRRRVGVSLSMDLPLTVLGPADVGTLPPTAAPAMRAALDAGLLAVVPGDPGTATVWWTVSPSTGATRSIMAPGLGGAFAGGSMPVHAAVSDELGGGGWTPGGGSYTNATPNDVVYEIDENLNTIVHKDGRSYRLTQATAASGDCAGGEEYIAIIGCVSTPTAWLIGGVATVISLVCLVAIYRMLR